MTTAARKTGDPVTGWTVPPAPGPAVIEGRSVRLERLDAARHAAPLHAAYAADPWVWDYMAYGPFAGADAYRAWVEAMSREADPYFYALVPRATGAAAGVASFLRITPAHGTIEVGHICLAPAMQGTVAATEALFRMAEWVFASGYRRYEWKCDAMNLPSRRAAERLGFSFEGVFRQHMVIKGRNRDTAWFAMTDRDWPALARAYADWLDAANFDEAGRQRRSLSALTRPLLVARDPLAGG